MDQDVIWVSYANQPKGKKLHDSEVTLAGSPASISVGLY